MTDDERSESVLIFWRQMGLRLANHPLYKDAPEEEVDAALEALERYVMMKIQHKVLHASGVEDKEKDRALLARTESFGWVTLRMLGLDVDLDDGNRHVAAAIHAVRRAATKQIPQDMLLCHSRCCRHLFLALRSVPRPSADPISADELLPICIYTVLRARVGNLQSCLQYISRFYNPARLLSGEAGYYFTTLCCAVAFIERIDAAALHISQAEFERHMAEYAAGDRDRTGAVETAPAIDVDWSVFDGLPDTESVRRARSQMAALVRLREQQESALRRARDVHAQLAALRSAPGVRDSQQQQQQQPSAASGPDGLAPMAGHNGNESDSGSDDLGGPRDNPSSTLPPLSASEAEELDLALALSLSLQTVGTPPPDLPPPPPSAAAMQQ